MTPLRNALTCSLLVVFSHMAGAAEATAPIESLRPLLATLNERLNIGDLVALTKWDSGKPIQDSPREAQVIAMAEAAGFKLVAEGNFLRNPNDPRDKNTPDPPMPKDEFFLKFVKP